MSATTHIQLPGYVAGSWLVDPIHSNASFTVRHLVSKVRGRFGTLEGEIKTADDPLDSSVTITVDADSIDTNNEMRDNHLRSSDFLEVDIYPTLAFTSTGIRPHGEDFLIDGNLTIKDVTRPITAELEVGGFAPSDDGVLRAGFTARFEIDRQDYNVSFRKVLETGGVLAGDRVSIEVEIEAILQE